jgi:hypothetical protein
MKAESRFGSRATGKNSILPMKMREAIASRDVHIPQKPSLSGLSLVAFRHLMQSRQPSVTLGDTACATRRNSSEAPRNISRSRTCAQEDAAKFRARRAVEFSTVLCVRCRSEAQKRSQENFADPLKCLQHKGLEEICDKPHLATGVQSQLGECPSMERHVYPDCQRL